MRLGFLLLLAVGLAAATATGFDGQVAAGELTVINAERVKVGTNELALADVDRLLISDGPLRTTIASEAGVQLLDGSWLPFDALQAGVGREHIAVRGPLGTLEIPLLKIAGWGRPDLPMANGSADVIRVASGPLPGTVKGLADGKLLFHSSMGDDQLPLDQVLALRLNQPSKRLTGLRLRAAMVTDQAPLDVMLKAEGLVLAAAPTVRLDPAIVRGLEFRVEGGRRIYLSDLPVTAVEEGMFGVVWPRTVDAAIGGAPLILGGRRYHKGLVVHSVATLTWSLTGAYTRLRAQVGISDGVAPDGDCVAVFVGDGKELWRNRVRGNEAPRALDLDLTGVASLTLRVEAGERFDIGDHLALADAQVIKAR
ncbi:MAG: NPCBM/NEW2 domain-containing protein [Planctomycetota bacterium]